MVSLVDPPVFESSYASWGVVSTCFDAHPRLRRGLFVLAGSPPGLPVASIGGVSYSGPGFMLIANFDEIADSSRAPQWSYPRQGRRGRGHRPHDDYAPMYVQLIHVEAAPIRSRRSSPRRAPTVRVAAARGESNCSSPGPDRSSVGGPPRRLIGKLIHNANVGDGNAKSDDDAGGKSGASGQ